MARTLTDLIGPIYEAADIVSQELLGAIPAVQFSSSAVRAAVGQEVISPITQPATAQDIVPGATHPGGGERPVNAAKYSISKARAVPITITGEDQMGLGDNWMTIFQDETAQAMRTLANEIEGDLCALYTAASRARGTAGTTPFGPGQELVDAFAMESVLDDNGAPMGTDVRSLLLNSVAKEELAKIIQLTSASFNTDPSLAFLRQGVLGEVAGFAFRKTPQVQHHTAGTAAGYQIDNVGGYPVGTTQIDVDVGAGTFLPGDVISIGGDSSGSQYVIAVGIAGPGTLEIAAPGLRGAVADNASITPAGDYTANMALARNAISLLSRPPAIPEEGDSALDSMIVMHDRSPLVFEIRMYSEYRRITYDVGIAWGMSVIKPEHLALLLG